MPSGAIDDRNAADTSRSARSNQAPATRTVSRKPAAAAAAACLVQLRDPDMFHHMAYGRDIAQHGLRAEEPFLYPMRGAKTGPMPYWLITTGPEAELSGTLLGAVRVVTTIEFFIE